MWFYQASFCLTKLINRIAEDFFSLFIIKLHFMLLLLDTNIKMQLNQKLPNWVGLLSNWLALLRNAVQNCNPWVSALNQAESLQ